MTKDNEIRLRKVEQDVAVILSRTESTAKKIDEIHTGMYGDNGMQVRVTKIEESHNNIKKGFYVMLTGALGATFKWLVDNFKHIFVASLVLLVGCLPTKEQRKCNHAERKMHKAIDKCPSLLVTDTVTVMDTVYMDSVRVDTAFSKDFDTVYINKDRFHVRLISKHDSIFVEGKCDSVLSIREIKVPCDTVTVQDKITIWQAIKYIWWLMLILLVLLYIFKK